MWLWLKLLLLYAVCEEVTRRENSDVRKIGAKEAPSLTPKLHFLFSSLSLCSFSFFDFMQKWWWQVVRAELPIVPMVPGHRAPRLRGAPHPPKQFEKKNYDKVMKINESVSSFTDKLKK